MRTAFTFGTPIALAFAGGLAALGGHDGAPLFALMSFGAFALALVCSL